MPTGLKITIIFNCFAIALQARVLFCADTGPAPIPVLPVLMSSPGAPPERAPQRPVEQGATTDLSTAAPLAIERRVEAPEPWVTLSDGSLRLPD
ncbi:hypothetical protein AAKU55_001037 [Oxalobacteraceae bacterium GrIS 1.11]